MGRISKHEHLVRLLSDPAIPRDVAANILNKMYPSGSSSSASIKDAQWRNLLRTAQRTARTLTTNSGRWSEANKPLYSEYIQLVQKAVARIQKGQLSLQEDGTPMSLAQYTAKVAQANALREARGEPSLGECNDQWSTWIPPHIRADYCARLRRHYADNPDVGKGRRLMPFVSQAALSQAKNAHKRIAATIANIRNVHANAGDALDSSAAACTPFGALYLAAARMAEREVARRKDATPPEPIPVNWHALLTPEMRKRLRRAVADPASVDPQGLEPFMHKSLLTGNAPKFTPEEALTRPWAQDTEEDTFDQAMPAARTEYVNPFENDEE